MPGTQHIKVTYGIDRLGTGFFWPDSTQKRQEVLSVKRNSPADFEATYQGRPGQREGSIFLSADLDNFYIPPADLLLGIASPAVKSFTSNGQGIYQAWDTAFSTSSQSAHTVCVTGLFVPCDKYHCNEDANLLGPCDFHFDVILLNVFRERLDWGGLTAAFKTQYNIWRPEQVIIEKKASGISLIQSMSATYPIEPIGTSVGKGARAVNSVDLKTAGSVQGWFRQHRVLVPDPTYAPWVEKWRTEMKDFSGADDASSDQVDATVHLITRAIIMGSSMAVLPSNWTPERSILPQRAAEFARQDLTAPTDPRAQLLTAIGLLPDISEDPYYGTCARCSRFERNNHCAYHNRSVVAFDSCEHYDDARESISTLA